jgi:cytoskeletal protein CcmA (bactofilin family)
MHVRRVGWKLLVFLFMVLAAPLLLAQEAGEVVIKRGTVEDDMYVAGRRVEVVADVQGDVVVAGQFVSIDQVVSGDVLAAGETVTIRAQVQDDVRAAGRAVTVAGPVAGHVVAAGEIVDIAPAVTIGGWAWLAGREVNMAGKVTGELKAAGQTVIVSGEIGSDVEIMAEEIRIMDGARIGGDLIYYSNREPDIADGARIAGDTIARPLPHEKAEGKGAGVVLLIALLVAALVYYLLFPVFSMAGVDCLRRSPLMALGIGVAVLFAMPFIILLLFITVIGGLVALPLLAGYLVSLLFGLLSGVIFVGDAGLRLAGRAETAGTGMRVFSFAVALAAILLLQLVPLLGTLIMLLVFVPGFGAFHLQLWRTYSGNRGQTTISSNQ